jgi:hypothetical protein
MTFKDTRLFELLRFIGVSSIGAIAFVIVLNVAQYARGPELDLFARLDAFNAFQAIRISLEEKRASLLALEHLTPAQMDELIAVEREIPTVIFPHDLYKSSMDLYRELESYVNLVSIILGVFGLLLIVLSIFVPRYAELMALFGGGFIVLNPILYKLSWWMYVAFAAAVIVILLWQYYLRSVQRDTPAQQARRKFALKVIAVYVIAFAMLHLTANMRKMVAAYSSKGTSQTIGQIFGFTDFDEEKADLLQTEHLTDAQKQRFVILEKEIMKEQQDAEQISVMKAQQTMAQEKKINLILLIILSIIALMALHAAVPLFVTCGCILGALLVLFYFVLSSVGLAVTGAFAALLFAVVAYRLYRLPRTQ